MKFGCLISSASFFSFLLLFFASRNSSCFGRLVDLYSASLNVWFRFACFLSRVSGYLNLYFIYWPLGSPPLTAGFLCFPRLLACCSLRTFSSWNCFSKRWTHHPRLPAPTLHCKFSSMLLLVVAQPPSGPHRSSSLYQQKSYTLSTLLNSVQK